MLLDESNWKKRPSQQLDKKTTLWYKILDPAFEQDHLTTLEYGNDMSVKEMHKIDGTMLTDCIKSPPKKESDFRNAIDKVMSTKIKQYSKLFQMFILFLIVLEINVEADVKTCNFSN